MATERLPTYVNPRKLADGRTAYYWCRPSWADPAKAGSVDEATRRRAIRRGKTCPIETTALGTDLAKVFEQGAALNEAFREWRQGVEPKSTPGSVQWLFAWYRDQEKFKAKRHKTRKGYAEVMDAVCEIGMRVGIFGARQASAVDGPAADKLYAKAKAKHGERQGSYMMQVCRLVWNHACRPGYRKATGVKDNPFAGMGIKASSGQGRGNMAASRDQYDLYRKTAHEMGIHSMAVAAALCFEGCQRVWDVFGFKDPDGRVSRGIFWDDYVPGERISLIQSKTGKLITLMLTMEVGGEVVQLYPELEDELALAPRSGEPGELIVRREMDGQRYPIDYMPKKHRAIREKAGLPKELRFTSFRHGGLTEIGDADVTDSRAVSGHTKVDTTTIYNKANAKKAQLIAAKRREHIAMLAGDSSAVDDVDDD